jgi:hypothetical protein
LVPPPPPTEAGHPSPNSASICACVLSIKNI